jgi:hypothetical protein
MKEFCLKMFRLFASFLSGLVLGKFVHGIDLPVFFDVICLFVCVIVVPILIILTLYLLELFPSATKQLTGPKWLPGFLGHGDPVSCVYNGSYGGVAIGIGCFISSLLIYREINILSMILFFGGLSNLLAVKLFVTFVKERSQGRRVAIKSR